jgi:molecular chaperone GrpE
MEENEKKEAGQKPEGTEDLHEEHKKKKKKDETIEELEHTLKGKEDEIKALQEKLLYQQADFENFKRLKVKEKQEILKFGNEALIQELMPVLDNLEMALEHASKTDDFKSIHKGVEITLGQFLKVLEKSGVVRVEAMGKKFDPNLHEALYQEEREDVEPDTVVGELQKGYLLNGRLVRPSRVCVSKKSEAE